MNKNDFMRLKAFPAVKRMKRKILTILTTCIDMANQDPNAIAAKHLH